MSDKPILNTVSDDEQPPILGSWSYFYWLVVILHFIIIGLFYWLTLAYA